MRVRLRITDHQATHDHASGEVLTRDVVVQATATTTVAEVLAQLQARRGARLVTDSGSPLPAEQPLARCGLRHGDHLHVLPRHAARPVAHPRHTGLWLSVVAGRGAGLSVPVRSANLVVGSATTADVRLPGEAEVAVTVAPTLGGAVTLLPAGTVLLAGEPVAELTEWAVGQRVQLSGSTVELVTTPPVLNHAVTGPAGEVEVMRPPRLVPTPAAGSFTLPRMPDRHSSRGFPVLMLLAPLLVAAIMVWLMGSWHYAAFAVLSPLMLLGSWLSARMGATKKHREDARRWQEGTDRVMADVADEVVAHQQAAWQVAPDPARLWQVVSAPAQGLWERSPGDPDFLALRVGVADQPSTITVDDPNADAHRRKTQPVAAHVPVVLSLPEHGSVGIHGPAEQATQVVLWCVSQVAGLHSPRAVSVVVLAGSGQAGVWDAAKWLPHCHHGVPGDELTVGVDADSVSRRLGQLTALIAERQAAMADRRQDQFPGPAIVVVWHASKVLRRLGGAVTVLRDGPKVGVYSICVDDQAHQLPQDVGAVIAVADDAAMSVKYTTGDDVPEAMADLVPAGWFDDCARAIAPYVDVGSDELSGLPDECRLLTLLGADEPEVQDVLARWAAPTDGLATPVGVGLDGPFVVDMVRDGPHALVAGTTGSGKSELLQTWVAGLAASYSAEDVVFVLVDYKGGAAFADCAQLPHTVGLVTDLDGHLASRCLASLRAELTYRETVLADHGVANIADYVAARQRRDALPVMPRLVVWVDEFAALAQELPEFVDGMIDIAQRGRSLGMHLVLATQRPAGVVTGPVRANTNLRVCLRVTSATESTDVVETADAALISPQQPGRGVARLGPAAVQPFQTARVAGTAAPEDDEPVVAVHGFTTAPATTAAAPAASGTSPDATQPADNPAADSSHPGSDRPATDLTTLVAAIRQAHGVSGVKQPRTPWFPALPEELPTPAAVWAVVDDPARQQQYPIRWQRAVRDHWFIIGAARTGRTTAALRLVASAVAQHTAAELHVYGVDCGQGGLAPLAQLPHCGAVVSRRDVGRVRRLLAFLTGVIAERGQHQASQPPAGAASAPQRPTILLVLDRFEGWLAALAEVDNGELHHQLLAVLSDGPTVGVVAVVTGDRQLGGGRFASLTENRLILRLNDRSDYTLMGIANANVPDDMPPGRAVAVSTGLTYQITTFANSPTQADQADSQATSNQEVAESATSAAFLALAALCTTRDASVPPANLPVQLRELPTGLTADQFRTWPGQTTEPMHVRCVVGSDAVVALGPDLTQHPVFTVAGPAQSGRSTVVWWCAQSLLAAGTELVVWAPRPSPLRDLANTPGVIAVVTEVAQPQAVSDALGDKPGRVLLVDDADMLKVGPAASWLADHCATVRDRGQGMIIAGLASELAQGLSGWPAALKQHRTGLLTSVSGVLDGELVGVRVSRSMVTDTPTVGKAHYHNGSGVLLPVVFPPTGPREAPDQTAD